MHLENLLQTLRGLRGAVELAPEAGSDAPEIAWRDHFFYYSPDGTVPQTRQPFATIVTKDYPDDTLSRLDPEGRWRLNIHVGTARFTEVLGESPREIGSWDYSEADTVLPHPVYGSLGWVSIVNPAQRTGEVALDLIAGAHEDEQRRTDRRG